MLHKHIWGSGCKYLEEISILMHTFYYITDDVMLWYCRWLQSFSFYMYISFNTLRPRQDGRHFADDVLKCIFLNQNVWILLKIRLKFVPRGPINNIPALVQIMAWRRPGDKPLSEPMMVNLPTHICVTRPQWVNDDKPSTNPQQTQCSLWWLLFKVGPLRNWIDVYCFLRKYELKIL